MVWIQTTRQRIRGTVHPLPDQRRSDHLNQAHVRLETKPPNIDGAGEVPIRHLVRNALRMRPDRITVGEVRGGEALGMLQAMNTGHDGSLTTVHANSPRDAVSRLETLEAAGFKMPPEMFGTDALTLRTPQERP